MPEEAGPQPATAAGINNLGGQHGKAGETQETNS
jgi:hypothetical protein